jgi:phenylpropionate dioxygenase-like ring-hydroxylating dioxygenase large terminal subunit
MHRILFTSQYTLLFNCVARHSHAEDFTMLSAPAVNDFPLYPVSWYLFGPSRAVGGKPVTREILGRRLVAYRTSTGAVVLMHGRCSHLGADLGQGSVVDDNLQCPFHHWQYAADGRCVHIPSQAHIPGHARQECYPVQERHGFIFFFNGPEPLFPLPFFEGCQPDAFTPARPFEAVLDCAWYLIGANAFDLQHFRAAHDRRLAETPLVECPAPFARRATGTFTVSGDSLQDRVTRLFAGKRVTMAITDWCGNLMFATATFRRTRSYGMVITEPTERGTIVRVIVFVPRSATWIGRLFKDWLHAWIRRLFIMRFLASDAQRLDGACYNPHSLIEADRDLADYFRWLAIVSHGRAAPPEPAHPASWIVVAADVNDPVPSTLVEEPT